MKFESKRRVEWADGGRRWIDKPWAVSLEWITTVEGFDYEICLFCETLEYGVKKFRGNKQNWLVGTSQFWEAFDKVRANDKRVRVRQQEEDNVCKLFSLPFEDLEWSSEKW